MTKTAATKRRTAAKATPAKLATLGADSLLPPSPQELALAFMRANFAARTT